MKRKSPVTFSNPLVTEHPIMLCGQKFSLVFDMQAVSVIIKETGHNIFTEGMPLAWLYGPKNLKAVIRGGLMRHHKDETPTPDDLDAFITNKNLVLVTVALMNAFRAEAPSQEDLDLLGIKEDAEALGSKVEEVQGPPKQPMPSSTEYGASADTTSD